MLPTLLVGSGVSFDWIAAYGVYWLVFYITACVSGFLVKFLHGLLRTPRAARESVRIWGGTSVALGLCDVPIIPFIATGWIALRLLPTGTGVVPPFSLFALASMCSVAALVRSLIERAIIRWMGGTQWVSGGLPFLFVANFAALALALTALYWWTILTSPYGGKGV